MDINGVAETITIHHGDVRAVLPQLASESVNTCITSPPYWGLRDYGAKGQLGREDTPEEYIAVMVAVFREVRRILRKDGTLWLNMGDLYNTGPSEPRPRNKLPLKQARNRGLYQATKPSIPTLKQKDLVGLPWMLAFALRSDGWYLRCDIIWHKPNPMPECVTDRPTRAHDYMFLLSKSAHYYYNQKAILEPLSPSTLVYLSKNVHGQIDLIDNAMANGGAKTNGNMKDVWRRRAKAWDYCTESDGRKRKLKLKLAEPGSGTKNNSSFDALQRNKRTVWTINTQAVSDAHFATFPEDLVRPCVLAGCPAGGTVLDPFFGTGTTGLVARANGCKCIGVELNPDYIEMARRRLAQNVLGFI